MKHKVFAYLGMVVVIMALLLTACQSGSSTQQAGELKFEVSEVPLSDAEAGIVLRHPTFIATAGNFAFVTGGETDNVAVVDLEILKPVKAIPVFDGTEPYRLILSSNGVLAVGGSKYVSLIDVSEIIGQSTAVEDTILDSLAAVASASTLCMFPCGGALVTGTHGSETYSVTSLAFAADGQQAYIGMIDRNTEGGALIAVDIMEGDQLREGFFAMTEASTQPLLLEVADLDDVEGIVLRSDEETTDVGFQKIAEIGDPDGLIIFADGRKAAVVDQDDSRLFIVDLETGSVLNVINTGVPHLQNPFDFIPHPGDSIDVVLTSDGMTAYVSNIRSNTIAVVSLMEGKVVKLIPLPGDPGGPYGLALSPNEQYLFTALWGSDELLVIDTQTQAVIQRVEVGSSPVGIAISSGGLVLVANSRGHNLSAVSFPELDLGK